MIIDLEPIFNIDGLVKDFDYDLDLSEEEFDSVKPFVSPVKVSGKVSNHAGIVEIDADASFVLDICCDRCAKPLKYPYSVKVQHTLVTSLNDENNDELLLVNELRFNLDELVTDDIFLDLPYKFLCKEDCKGLCPTCGHDLNEGPCNCKKAIDPRLEALAALLEE